jgi:hypothetical protein
MKELTTSVQIFVILCYVIWDINIQGLMESNKLIESYYKFGYNERKAQHRNTGNNINRNKNSFWGVTIVVIT